MGRGQTHKQTNRQTDRRTSRLLDRIGPVGRFGEKGKSTNQKNLIPHQKKSRIWETKHRSTDADSNADTTVGWTKNTQKPIFIEKHFSLGYI